jgi:hypothetical protein
VLDFPPDSWPQALRLFFALAIGHAIADFPLQGDFLAMCKNRWHLARLNDPARPPSMWLPCMAAHCLIHSGMVWMITGSSLLAVTEFILHWLLDVAKCAGKTQFVLDQCLHYVCKAAYVALGWMGVAGVAAARS